ncbi:hypothetical protein RB195_002379 [Necator americanus]|uniref:Uncharacterized protein n=1 Tax=Necator americanus TaxID=51031 RepID=A0ABR1DIS5_NECAM
MAFAPVRKATDELKDQGLSAHLLDSTILAALCYATKTAMSRLRDPAKYVCRKQCMVATVTLCEESTIHGLKER